MGIPTRKHVEEYEGYFLIKGSEDIYAFFSDKETAKVGQKEDQKALNDVFGEDEAPLITIRHGKMTVDLVELWSQENDEII